MNTTPITLVTGNLNKLRELQAIFPKSAKLTHAKLSIAEIQGETADPYEILEDKLVKAYGLLQAPIIVEDVSAELGCFNGLPGPFVKFFERKLGNGALWKMAEHAEDHSLTVRCLMGYFDGKVKKIVEGVVRGEVVPPRGTNGFGFDSVFMPNGHTRTTAEMTAEEKNEISWRGLAATKLAHELFPDAK